MINNNLDTKKPEDILPNLQQRMQHIRILFYHHCLGDGDVKKIIDFNSDLKKILNVGFGVKRSDFPFSLEPFLELQKELFLQLEKRVEETCEWVNQSCGKGEEYVHEFELLKKDTDFELLLNKIFRKIIQDLIKSTERAMEAIEQNPNDSNYKNFAYALRKLESAVWVSKQKKDAYEKSLIYIEKLFLDHLEQLKDDLMLLSPSDELKNLAEITTRLSPLFSKPFDIVKNINQNIKNKISSLIGGFEDAIRSKLLGFESFFNLAFCQSPSGKIADGNYKLIQDLSVKKIKTVLDYVLFLKNKQKLFNYSALEAEKTEIIVKRYIIHCVGFFESFIFDCYVKVVESNNFLGFVKDDCSKLDLIIKKLVEIENDKVFLSEYVSFDFKNKFNAMYFEVVIKIAEDLDALRLKLDFEVLSKNINFCFFMRMFDPWLENKLFFPSASVLYNDYCDFLKVSIDEIKKEIESKMKSQDYLAVMPLVQVLQKSTSQRVHFLFFKVKETIQQSVLTFIEEAELNILSLGLKKAEAEHLVPVVKETKKIKNAKRLVESIPDLDMSQHFKHFFDYAASVLKKFVGNYIKFVKKLILSASYEEAEEKIDLIAAPIQLIDEMFSINLAKELAGATDLIRSEVDVVIKKYKEADVSYYWLFPSGKIITNLQLTKNYYMKADELAQAVVNKLHHEVNVAVGKPALQELCLIIAQALPETYSKPLLEKVNRRLASVVLPSLFDKPPVFISQESSSHEDSFSLSKERDVSIQAPKIVGKPAL